MSEIDVFPFLAQAMQVIAIVAGVGIAALLIVEALSMRRRRAVRERRQKSVEDRSAKTSLRLATSQIRSAV